MSGIKRVRERLTCPSLPSRGRHDQPRAFTNRRQVSKFNAQPASIRLEPSRSCGKFEQTGASTVGVEARSRPRSVSEPCVCPSARTDIDLEGITASAHKKEPVPRYRPRDRSNYSIAGWNARSDSSTSTDATLVIVLAVDHRGRQLTHRAIGLVVSDRCMLLTLLLLAFATVQA